MRASIYIHSGLWMSHFYICCIVSAFSMGSILAIQSAMLYSTPVETHDVQMVEEARQLLDCGRRTMPEQRGAWNAIDICLDTASVHKVPAGRMPYFRYPRNLRPVAWVFKYGDKHNMFMGPKYSRMNAFDRATVVIHECSHLALNTQDYAYIWEDKFRTLTPEEHAANADSFVYKLIKNCALF